MSGYLWHVTLTTGRGRRSPRAEVSDDAIAIVGRHLNRALDRDGDELPGGLIGYRLTTEKVGAGLLATVSWGEVPIVTMGVAGTSRAAAPLWRILHRVPNVELATDPGDVPAAPWVAVILWPTLAAAPSATEWLGDYERCLAWAWLEAAR